MRRRAPKCAGIRGHVGVQMGVPFRKVGVHRVLYPTPPATRQRQPCACQPPPQYTPWQARHTATAPAVAQTQQAPTTNRGRGRHSPGHGNTHGAHLAAADQGAQQSTNNPATQVFNGGKGCILRHSHTSNRAAHQHQILRGMTIFTGDTGDKL